jgi:hypothetical protein
MSRSRTQTKIYAERAEVGDTIAELSKTMSNSRQKDTAQEFQAREILESRERTVNR